MRSKENVGSGAMSHATFPVRGVVFVLDVARGQGVQGPACQHRGGIALEGAAVWIWFGRSGHAPQVNHVCDSGTGEDLFMEICPGSVRRCSRSGSTSRWGFPPRPGRSCLPAQLARPSGLWTHLGVFSALCAFASGRNRRMKDSDVSASNSLPIPSRRKGHEWPISATISPSRRDVYEAWHQARPLRPHNAEEPHRPFNLSGLRSAGPA